MAKSLVIAEKPSVATDLSRVIGSKYGKFEKDKDFFENDQFVISSAVGHLVEIGAPPDQEPKRGKWNIANLPVVPTYFELNPIKKSEARFKLIKKLIKRKDIDCIINACDAGREGELIFRYIIQLVGSKKPTKRLWMQSMTPAAIVQQFERLRSDEEMLPLADAAICRSEADWLVGINGTRAMTSFNSQGGGFHKTTVGRVQTPTLTIVVKREEKIKHFEPKPYWEVHGSFGAEAGEYMGRWFDESFKKPAKDRGEEDKQKELKAERIWDEAKAKDIAEFCKGKIGAVEEKSKPSSKASPLLFDLTSLQREGNSKFGFSARSTLQFAQSLYERHKLLTYPRTDSRYLPEDYISTVVQTMEKLKGMSYASHAGQILKEGWIRPNKRIFNQAKVSDHFAIIPTLDVTDKKLNEGEQRIFDLVVKRFLAVFFPPAVYEVTTRLTRVEEHTFKTEGKVLKEPGWLAIYGKEAELEAKDKNDQPTLIPLQEGEKVNVEDMEIHSLATKPPARFSEATLLSAMESAGKLVEDEELRDAMAEKGLGTPATRASIIENLIAERYLLRNGRELEPTPKAFNLLETINVMKIPALSSPELTGEWEYKLKMIERGELSRPEFMKEIQDITRDVVEGVRGFNPEEVETREIDLHDPFSGAQMIETLRDFRTKDGSLVVRKAIAGRIMDLEEVRELLANRVVGPLDEFRSRMGRPFSAYVRLDDSKEVTLDWGNGSNGSEEEANFEGQEPVGICPTTGLRVFETPNAFVTESPKGSEDGTNGTNGKTSKAGDKTKFRVSKKILEQEITREQVVKLLTERKTDLMSGFVSKKTRRPFKAFLILKEDGTTGFEFPPREAKKKAAKKVAKKAVTKKS
ncbi:MAG: DNA topoisomerase III [Verrucomicrobiota bacterium]